MGDPILEGIAIIAVHGRFPGAGSVEEFWSNLVAGRETISIFTDQELAESGLDPVALRKAGQYVPARGVLKDGECFDAAFFGIHPKEAEVLDPQQRVFLEACWEALERAGYGPGRIEASVGVFGGATYNTYYLHVLHPRPDLRELVGPEQIMLGNEKDYLATRVAYKLNLRGPALSLNTACSSSLVAACQACQALLTYQCDIALAGGVSVTVPQKRGYFYQEGNIGSPDGHTRTFDASAQGTAFSNGVTLVVLKRLDEAVRDGDQVLAVIKGVGVNNDGAQRVSFGAPGVEGQSEVISLAHAVAGVEADSITYVEAHGTATPIGDPIEVAALTRAFRRSTSRTQFCALGSLKTNVGHLDAAAGTAGLIKTALALHHKILPPSLHFRTPNPKLELEKSPFFVNSTLREWKSADGTPLRAGVSSFGTGGTNAHVVLEEAPPVEPGSPSRRWKLVLLSAKTPNALELATLNLGRNLKANSDADLADVAYTLQVGRAEFVHRRAIIGHEVSDTVASLEKLDARRVSTGHQDLRNPPVVFMFPGQGAQYVQMGAEVYRQEKLYREILDECAEILVPILGLDLRKVLFADSKDEARAAEELKQTRLTQPALFATEYALARLWMSWGIQPSAMIGHSVGEYVAGCLAGVFSLPEAITLVARRAEMVQAQPPGAMLAVRLGEDELRDCLNGSLSLAAVNAPNLCVVSGPDEAIAALEKTLATRGVAGKRLPTSHAFHSEMMEPVVGPFTEYLRRTRLAAPQIPYVSNVTGRWVTAAETTSPEYWARHVRQTVRFADGLKELVGDSRQILLEVGPGQTLAQLARQHPGRREEQPVLTTIGPHRDQELCNLALTMGRLWTAGVTIDWTAYYQGERRRRVVLPTYPFERKRYWPESPVAAVDVAAPLAPALSSVVPPGTHTPAELPVETGPSAMSPRLTRKEHLLSLLRTLLQELSGTNLDSADASTTLLEIGLDSLLLTQAATLFQRRFGVPISFRQLMEDLISLEQLAAYLDANLPAGAFEPAAPVSPSTPVPSRATEAAPVASAGSATVPVSGLEQLLHQQLQVTSQLLAFVRGQGTAGPVPATAVPTPAPSSSSGASIQNAASPALVSGPATPRSEVKSHGPFRPMDRGSTGGLSEQQQRWLDEFIRGYTQRTAGSKKLAAQNRAGLADPRSASGFKQLWKEMVYPLYTERSQDARVWDVDGNEYIDYVMGFGASLFGHRPSFVVEAIQKQLERGFEIGPIQPVVGEAAALVRELTGAERVAFCNTGSEAVLGAIRVARTVTGRDKIAMFSGAYHGIFDEVLARPLTVNGEIRAAPIAPGIPQAGTSQVMVFDWGNPESLELLRRCAHELAAVFVEPVQSRRLDLQPREFLHELRRITEASGTAFIFDEVVTGFRVHPGGAQTYFGIRADMATYGKVVGGGLPVGVVAGKARFLDALDGGSWHFGDTSFPEVGVTFFAGTFVRHPITMAVAKAVLEHLKREGPALQEKVASLAARTADRVRAVILERSAPLHLAHFSSMMYLTVQPEFRHGGLLFYLLRNRGIHIWENRAFVFTTAHTPEDSDRLVRALEESLDDLTAAGFLAGGTGKSAPAIPTPSPGEKAAIAAIEAPAVKPPVSEPQEFELTEAQQEVWLAALLDERASQSYNITFLIRLAGPLQEAALERCLQEWVNRHDSLRTSFDTTTPIQCVLPQVKLPIVFTDATSTAPSDRKRTVEELARKQAERTFDFSQPPLLRAQVVKFAADENVLVITYSHLIADGWSGGVLLHELKLLYAAAINHPSQPLEPALQFTDYVRLLDTDAFQSARARSEAYWRGQFATLPPALDLPTDRVRPAQRTFSADRVTVHWDAAFYQALKKASARQGTTLLTYLLAGFKILLHRLSGQEDLVVGLPAAGQLSAALQETPGSRALVGHCVNLLPVRSQCREDPTFSAFTKQLKRSMLDAFENQDLTFGRLLELLNVPRDASRVPLVPVLFNLDRAVAGFQLEQLETSITELPRSSLVFDLSVNVIDNDRDLSIDCDFSTDLFDAATIRRWIGHFRRLLESAVANPNDPLSRLEILSEAESRQVLHEWNQTRMDFQEPLTLTALVEAQVARTPDAIALVWDHQRLTYQELNRRANVVAARLQQERVGPESIVGVCMRRSMEMVIAMLGVLKAGAAYVPLDPQYPRDRVQFMLEDTAARVVLIQNTTREVVGDKPGVSFISLDEFDWNSAVPATPPPQAPSPRNLAYIIYTSGSTGRPKGVAIEHRSAAILVRWALKIFLPEELAGVLFSTSICFDLSIFELFVALSAGGRVIGSENALSLGDLPAKNEVTLINTVPSAMSELVRRRAVPPGVQVVNLAGEPLKTSLVDQIYSLGTVRKVYDLYGPSEDTTYSTWALREAHKPATIGRPMANTEVYLLDSHLRPVPIGVAGELYIGGDGLARGYLNRPELTSERFLPHPFDPQSGRRVYRTGDWARYRPDGNIEFLGRLDHQVKLRGFRIEMGEIEAVLSRHSAVQQCVVVVRDTASSDKQLVAYIEPRPGAHAAPADLRAEIRKALPDYMVPQHFVILPALPLTPNRKIDRKALPAPEETAGAALSTTPSDAPVTATEKTLAELWRKLLQVPFISRSADFFDLGGHSLLAVRMFDEIEKTFGRRFPLATILRSPTLTALAGTIDEANSPAVQVEWKSLVPINPNGTRHPLFCVHGGGGEVLFARELIRHLPSDQPFYALQARAVRNLAERDATVEAMAEHYLEEVRSLQPSGPYYLSGFCMGGLVAYEMAQRVLAAGEQVGLVILIDTYNPIEAARVDSRYRRGSKLTEKIAFHWGNIVGLQTADRAAYFTRRLSMMLQYRMRRLMGRITLLTKRVQRREGAAHGSRFLLEEFNDRVGSLYTPRPLAAKVLVIRPQKTFKGYDDPAMGWSSLVRDQLEVANIQVNPGGMFVPPYIGMVGDRLTKALDGIERSGGQPPAPRSNIIFRPAIRTV